MNTMKAQKHEQLNSSILDFLDMEQFVEQYIYLTNKERGQCATVTQLRRAYESGNPARLLKQYDPIFYNQVINEL